MADTSEIGQATRSSIAGLGILIIGLTLDLLGGGPPSGLSLCGVVLVTVGIAMQTWRIALWIEKGK